MRFPGRLLFAGAAGVLAVALAAAPAPARAQAVDPSLADRVAVAIREYSHLSIFDDVRVDAESGAVRLSGAVTLRFKREDLGARVATVDGVRRVVNDIRVLPDSPSDARIRLDAARAIYAHPAFRHYAAMAAPPIRIVVEHGRVTLAGRVATEVERRLALALADVAGVIRVVDELDTRR